MNFTEEGIELSESVIRMLKGVISAFDKYIKVKKAKINKNEIEQ